MPIYELIPKKEIFFPLATINQSLYQTLKIQNKSDTLNSEQNEIFRIHKNIGWIPTNEFNLVCIVYRRPLLVMFNNDSSNVKTILVNILCTDSVIELEGIKNNIFSLHLILVFN